MIVNCVLYRGNSRERLDGDISDALDAVRGTGGGFAWIGLHEPTVDELQLVTEELKLHPLAIEDAMSAHQRPKLERFGDTLLVVLKPMRCLPETSGVEVGNILAFIGDDFIVTVRHGAATPLAGVRERYEAEPVLFAYGPSGVLHAICDEVVDHYGAIAHEIESEIIKLERQVFGPDLADITEDIYGLKREVLEFRTAEDPLIPMLRDIVKGKAGMHRETLEYFRDVLDHLMTVDRMIDSHNELLTNVLNSHLAHIAMRQNEDMRKISAWAAIFAVPTMVTGIYGMNFDSMPELKWKYGYGLTMVVVLAACAGIHRFFRRRGWL